MSEANDHYRLRTLFLTHAPAVLSYARRRSDAAVADDVVSEVFLAAWRRLDDVPEDPLPWLLACARRILANQRRVGRRQRSLQDRLASEASRLTQGDAPGPDPRLLAALDSLQASDRELLLLTAWEDLSIDRAASVLGCSRGTCAVRLHRARRRLAAALAAPAREPAPGLVPTRSNGAR